VKFIELPYPAMGPALDAGRIDAAYVAEPFLTPSKKNARLLAFADDAIGLLEVRSGDKVLVIGEALEVNGWGEGLRALVGPAGTVDVVEIIKEGRETCPELLRVMKPGRRIVMAEATLGGRRAHAPVVC
jgi:hypothetical protein